MALAGARFSKLNNYLLFVIWGRRTFLAKSPAFSSMPPRLSS